MPITRKADFDHLDRSRLRSKGTYALLMWVSTPSRIPIRLSGGFVADRGWYVYIGSAFGPGGLAARVQHHMTPSPRTHWHIDEFKSAAKLREIWFTYDTVKRESLWTGIFGAMRASSVPCLGFGASDCDGETHLFGFAAKPSKANFRRRLQIAMPAHARVYRKVLGRATF